MAEMISKRQGIEKTVKELGLVAGGAVLSDSFLSGFVGNATLKSGIVKAILGYYGGKNLSGSLDYIMSGVFVDGVMDIAQSLLKGNLRVNNQVSTI